MKTRLSHLFRVLVCLVVFSIPLQKVSAQYCTPAYSLFGCSLGDDIDNFTLIGASSSISDLGTGCSSAGYDDRTAIIAPVTLMQGGTYSGTVSIEGFLGSANAIDGIQIYIDFNDDNTFATSESVGGVNGVDLAPMPYSITIPATATIGSHRMRVVMASDGDATYPGIDPCAAIYIFGIPISNYSFGEAHDYLVNITGTAATCAPVTGLTMSAITASSATLSWTAVTGALGYEWVVDMVATAPTGSGTATTATTANATGLTASTTYYAHVRTKCSATSFSTWVTTTFTTTATPACAPVTGLTMSAITAASATLNWTAVTGALGYEWTVDMVATAPTGAGTATTATTANATGLTASTVYYAHVRTKCSATSYSTWVTTTFTTTAPGACTAPTVTLGASTSTTQVINWTAVSGATGYEWTVDMVATAPTGAGTATTATTATATGLIASTSYYAHVRTICSATSSSAWTTIPFTTAPVAGACNPVTGLTASSITTSSALVSWTAVAGSAGYQYVINTVAADPAGSGANTLATNTTATGLTAATTYYAHVRDSCGPGVYSAWVTIPFTTLSASCPSITGLTASAITLSSATVSWTAITGSIGYEYVIDNTPSTPAGAGTLITTNTYNATALTSATTYYAHVRNKCSATSYSAWNTIPFTTLSTTCNAVTSLMATTITSHSAVIYWTSAAGTVAAKYVIDLNPADPIVSGTTTSISTASISGLMSATTYYAHVRDSCGAGSVSAWVTIPLTTLGSGVGIVDVNAAGDFNISAFPNPVKETLTIEMQGTTTGNAQIQLMDMTGKLIRTIAVTDHTMNMDMNGLASGLYLIRYIDAEHTQTVRVSKQ